MHPDKIVIIIRDDLKVWQKLNVIAFLASALATGHPELHGVQLVTASGNKYLPFLKQPMLLYKAENIVQLQRLLNGARERELHLGIYQQLLFATTIEEENLRITASFKDDEQGLAGILIYGDVKKVNKAVDGLKFHD